MTTAARPHSIRGELRMCTRGVHEELHEHSVFVDLFNGTAAKRQYSALMRSFHGFYVPMERGIDRALSLIGPNGVSFSYAKRADLLAQDLQDLGDSAQDIDNNPVCERISNIVTPHSLPGVLYVIEGSTLGAAQIDRAAQKILRPDKPHGRRFWAWSRANNTARWTMLNAYLAQLEDYCQPTDAILQGATDTFQALADWLAPLDQRRLILKGAIP
ncbi:MAG: biliverdin-producing heme oxygenase [Paracoccaceae bacterium]